MTKQQLLDLINAFVREDSANIVRAEDALSPELAGLRMYDTPLVGFADAKDKMFTETFKKPGIIHPDYWEPEKWLPEARTVVSIFLPFTEEVRASNRTNSDAPTVPGVLQSASSPWLHARIEGQLAIALLTARIKEALEADGFSAVVPATSGKFQMLEPYISTWSERHAAHAAGLGTFGLSKGLITEKGMAGRFASVITSAEFEPTPRPYSTPFEYCTMCGACMRRCPVNAIDISKGCALGKDQFTCDNYVIAGKQPPHGPNKRVRYGCGKCQCGVPCENKIPGK